MKNLLDQVKNERQLKSLIGLSQKEFDTLLEVFLVCLEEIKQEQYRKNRKHRKRRPGGGRKGALGTAANKLFFILCYLKNYPTFDVLAFIFGISLSKAQENVKKLIPVLKRAEEKLDVLPKRSFKEAAELAQIVENNEDIMIDVTEREHFRPKDNKKQRKYYSGKKKKHTVKNTVISTASKKILFLGKTVPGSIHDYRLFKNEFNPNEDWFKSVEGWFDLGYQGIKTDYQSPENIHIPHKKPKKSKTNPNPSLTHKQKQENQYIGSKRVAVEHAIGGIKIFHILTTKFRNRAKDFVDNVVFLVTGLWNLKNSYVFQ